jgi:hypothetical protein
MIDIIITLDYEIFGNGVGDVKKHIIEPTENILEICEKYNAKLTIMFEIGEYWAFKRAEKKGKLTHLNYCASELMENQAKYAINKGHDVQLHLHPQWIDAEFIDGNWKLNLEWWRLSDLPLGIDAKKDSKSIIGILYKGKTDLEKMLKPVNNNYNCIGFRAGGWCIQPEKKIISAMKYVDIKADTSVFKWGYEASNISFFDFREAKNNYGYWWTTEENVNRNGEKGKNIIEIPIYSQLLSPLYLFKPLLVLVTLKTKFEQKNNSYTLRQNHKFNLLFEQNKIPFKWDFCKQSSNEMIRYLNKILLEHKHNKNAYLPLVMIGHSKDFLFKKNFEDFLKKIQKHPLKEIINYSTFSSSINRILENLND